MGLCTHCGLILVRPHDHALGKMKRLFTVLLLAWCAAAHATEPDYKGSCVWVIEHCTTNQVPKDERVFVATTPGSALPSYIAILRYHDGLSIRNLIDQTRFSSTNAAVSVYRSGRPFKARFHQVVKAGELPTFKLKPLDMIWIGDPKLPQT